MASDDSSVLFYSFDFNENIFKQHLLNMDVIPNPKWILFYSFKTVKHIKYILLTYFCSSSVNTSAFIGQEKVTNYNI